MPLINMPKTALQFSLAILVVLAITPQAQATSKIMAEYNAPSCTTCHTRGAYSESEGKAGLTAFLAAIAEANRLAAAYNLKHRPTISPIALEWDIDAGQTITIPLTVADPDQDAFRITGTLPSGNSFSPQYTAENGLLATDFSWTPTAAQANKVYTVKFIAQETASAKRLFSAGVTAKIRVWPSANREQSYISQLTISTAKWTNGKLTLKGQVALNKIMTVAEKANFLKRTDLTVKISQGADGKGITIADLLPITLLKSGGWTLANLTLSAPFACDVTVAFEGTKAARKIASAPKGCLK
ncbi:MAG: hypothetical protein NTV43_07950 [Methylococcales bacterium]|nr:hypothetical protein [Methylococcales bacterium]